MKYIQGGGIGSGGSGSSGGGRTGSGSGVGYGASGGNISAIDILELSNSDNPGAIADLFNTGGTVQTTEAGTQVVTFPASDIGLPADGTATLTISGGSYSYSGTASVDANGNVTFEIPLIPSGTLITVGLTVKRADGVALYAGSKEQVARGDSMQISISLAPQFWTLPDPLHVIASPASILYNPATADTATSMLSLEGFESAPASVTYVWTDEAGTQLGTGATLTRTANEVTGGIAPADEITKTYTVTVSYTDITGTARTASASASVTVGLAVVLPAFSISMTAPASAAPAESASSPWHLTDLTDSFTLTPVAAAASGAAGGSFPGGTTFHWEIEATGGALITRTTAVGEDCTVSPADLELNESTIGRLTSPTTITVRCTAKNDRADDDVDAPAVTQGAYFTPTIPAYHIHVSPFTGATGSTMADGSKVFYITAADLSQNFTLTALVDSSDPTVTFPSGTQFQWNYPGIGASYSTASDAPLVQTAGSLFNTTSVSNTLGTPYTLQCQAVLDGSTVSGATATVDVYLVSGMSASTLAGKTTAQLGSTKLSGSGSTEADPYVLPSIIGLENSAVRNDLKNKMNSTWRKYCDLSNTVLPDTMTDMSSAFNSFTYMTAAPVIPSSVTNMEQCFYRCSALTTAPVIPEGVTNMKQCFYQCPLLTTAPAIPEGVTNMEDCFYQCIYLTTAPVIPSTVTNMRGCFEKCSALTTAPDIPEGVTDMTKCFEKCSALTTAPAIPSSVDNMDRCFEECTSLTAAPAIPEGVINMTKCFNECTSLTTASIIPSTVTDLTRCFKGCINLTGDVVIRANITDSDNYRGMFDVHSDGSGSYHWPGASNPIRIYVPTEAARNALITALKTPVDAISANTNFVYTEGSDPNPDGSIGTGNIKIYVGEP